jgi:hypothetical protein
VVVVEVAHVIELDGLGVERRPVAELDAFAQLEGIDAAASDTV